jgi:hypothetical protein
MPFFSIFRSKDATSAKKQPKNEVAKRAAVTKPKWTDAFARTQVAPEEVQELLRGCTLELKSRGATHTLIMLVIHFC